MLFTKSVALCLFGEFVVSILFVRQAPVQCPSIHHRPVWLLNVFFCSAWVDILRTFSLCSPTRAIAHLVHTSISDDHILLISKRAWWHAAERFGDHQLSVCMHTICLRWLWRNPHTHGQVVKYRTTSHKQSGTVCPFIINRTTKLCEDVQTRTRRART